MRIAVLASLLLLAACGHKGALTRIPPDENLTEAERRAIREKDERETAAGLRLPPEAIPVRQDDVLAKTRSTAKDQFELAPE
jgi:predicted small lipoprotein YifL